MAQAFIRNLIYHVTPIGNYLWNLEQLQRRIHLFNGKQIIIVAQDKYFDSPDKTQSFFPNAKILTHKNDPKLREAATFLPLLTALKSQNTTNDITFYGHTKGVTKPKDEAVKLWTEHLYKYNLDHINKIDSALSTHHTVGSFRRYGMFKHFPRASTWHYSGTFFWFRNAALFSRDWQSIPNNTYAVEAYPSLMFRLDESACLFADNIKNLYNLRYLKAIISRRDPTKKLIGKRIEHESLPINHDRREAQGFRALRKVDQTTNVSAFRSQRLGGG